MQIKPKLVRWVEDNCPPIDLNDKPGYIIELVSEYQKLFKALEDILEEIPKKPKLPLTITIKEIAEKAILN